MIMILGEKVHHWFMRCTTHEENVLECVFQNLYGDHVVMYTTQISVHSIIHIYLDACD